MTRDREAILLWAILHGVVMALVMTTVQMVIGETSADPITIGAFYGLGVHRGIDMLGGTGE